MSMPDIIATIIGSSTPREQHTACGVLSKDDTAEYFLSATMSLALCFRVSVDFFFWEDWLTASRPIKCMMGRICKQPVHTAS